MLLCQSSPISPAHIGPGGTNKAASSPALRAVAADVGVHRRGAHLQGAGAGTLAVATAAVQAGRVATTTSGWEILKREGARVGCLGISSSAVLLHLLSNAKTVRRGRDEACL